MKTARAYPYTIEVICPECNEPTENPHNGSFMWDVAQYAPGEVHVCCSCNKKFKLPSRIGQPDI